MPTRNKKYKYAIEKELAWLQDDLDIIEDELKRPEAGEGSLRKTELLLRRIWASNEMGRLDLWMREFRNTMRRPRE